MRKIAITLTICLAAYFAVAQTILKGKVVNQFGSPIEYANIGIVNKSIGTITGANGTFNLCIKTVDDADNIRFSMIGFIPQCFELKNLLGKESTIVLQEQQIQLNEVVVKPRKDFQEKGNKGHSWLGKCCGWGGTEHGKGSELGTKVSLGNDPVRIQKLCVRILHHSFDSSLFRLHIRNIVDNKPDRELLSQNIYLPISKKSGWVTFDLRKYDLFLSGDIAVTLEWIKVIGINNNRLVRVNRSKEKTPEILISVSGKSGCLYKRWAHDDSWTVVNSCFPSFYFVVN